MLGLSRQVDYAVVALAHLARRRQVSAGVLSARQLAEAEGLPPAALSGLLKRLQRAGLVCSKRGAGGGYELVRSPERLAVAEVIEAVEGADRVQLASCCGHDGCRIEGVCPITGAVRRANRQLESLLRGTTLADLLRPDGSARQPSDNHATTRKPQAGAHAP